MVSATEEIARFISRASMNTIPADAIEKSKKVLADTFAVILAGAGGEVAPPLVRYVKSAGQGGSARILGLSDTAPPEIAALVNGTFGHALDYDDVLSMMPAHPSAVILAAVLAEVGRMKLTGRDLLQAHIVGIEVGGRIGLAITQGHYNRGFHGTGTLGIFSAIGAMTKLYGLDASTTAMAFGIVSSMASGVRCNFGTMTKPLHTGWAARNALVAADLARCGLSASPRSLEAKSGFFDAYGVEASDASVACQNLGEPWVMSDPGIALKRYPCCYASHRAIEATLALREKLGVTAETLERLDCRMPPGGMRVLTYPEPTTGLEAKFSLQYPLAASVLDGKCTLTTFKDEAVNRAAIKQLLKKVDAREDPRCVNADALLENRSPGSRGFVEVEIRTTDGRSEVMRVVHPSGHPTRELGWREIKVKFLDCAAQASIDAAKTESAFAQIQDLEKCEDLDQILRLLTH